MIWKPGLCRMRGGATAEIKRTKTYRWSSKYSSGNVTFVEGEHCQSGQMLNWDPKDGSYHLGNGQPHEFDLVR